MKINIYDHIVENKIVSVSEEGIVYDLPRGRPQEIWDRLSNYYNAKLNRENTTLVKIDEFFKSLAFARVENETMLETFRLSRNSILKPYNSTENKEEKANIKNIVRQETLSILKKRLDELRHNIEKERIVYQDIKKMSNEVIIVGNKLKIITSPFSFMDFEDFQGRVQSGTGDGLTCVLKFNDMTIKGFYRNTSVMSFSQYEGSFTRGNIQITLSSESCGDENEVCSLIVEEILRNHRFDEIAGHIHLVLSRYCSRQLVRDSKMVKYVEIGDIKLIDGMTPVFYIVCDMGVVKVKRSEDSFEIHLNGQKMADLTELFSR